MRHPNLVRPEGMREIEEIADKESREPAHQEEAYRKNRSIRTMRKRRKEIRRRTGHERMTEGEVWAGC